MFAIMGLIIGVAALAATLVPAAFSAGQTQRELAREEARAVAAEKAVEPKDEIWLEEFMRGTPVPDKLSRSAKALHPPKHP